MNVIIAGATGFIGRKLIEVLDESNNSIVAVSRNTEKAYKVLPANVHVIDYESQELKNSIEKSDVVINLAGDPIGSGKWTEKKKMSIMNSRIHTARRLTEAVKSSKNNNLTFIQASAIGYYGNVSEDVCYEETPKGSGFLADVCSRWEGHVPELNKYCKRVLTLRIGLVLGNSGGMLPELLKLSKRRIAGKLGRGDQWYSWIHIYDLVHAINYLINKQKASGVYNLVAPQAVRQGTFSSILARNCSRKMQISAPGFMIKLVMGEMGKELLLSGQRVSPSKLLREGFMFKFEELTNAMNDLILTCNEPKVVN